MSIPAPSTPLGPFEDSAVAWTTWVTLMGFVGFTAFALVSAGPVARRLGPETLGRVTARLSRAAVLLGLLAVPAVLTDLAHDASDSGGYDYGAAWNSLFDGTNDGRLAGLEVTLSIAGAALLLPLVLRRVAGGRARTPLLGLGLLAGVVALGTTKFPTKRPTGHQAFEAVVWQLHIQGGAVWIGGLAGLLLLLVPGAVAAGDRGAFWGPAIRRFSAAAMSAVAAISLSGLFLYWEHVDGPSQLVSTMYGRVLGVKILLFGSLLVLGAANQFWLHPKVEALRAGGDTRPLRTVLVREFPAVVAVELLFGMSVLFVAPFLSGSARNQAFQADAAKTAPAGTTKLPKAPAKTVTASTWVWGTAETIVVVGLMGGGYVASGRMAGRRRAGATDWADAGASADRGRAAGAGGGDRTVPEGAGAV